jgi:hypothetical protein
MNAIAPILSLYEKFGERDSSSGMPMLHSTFKRCLFKNIKQGPFQPDGLVQNGIITGLTPNNIFTIEDCTFKNNVFPGVEDSSDEGSSDQGYAIKTTGTTLELKRNCFYNNTFSGWGTIQAFVGTNVILETADYAQPIASGINCNYIAMSQLLAPVVQADVKCLKGMVDICTAPVLDGVPHPGQS